MPLEHILISHLSESNLLNVLMMKSIDILQPYTSLLPQEKRIEISRFGFRWIEENVEQHVILGEMFELNSSDEDSTLLGNAEEHEFKVTFACTVKRINQYSLDQKTIKVELGSLPFRIEANVLLSLNCNQCAYEIVETRSFNSIMPFPVVTMRPESYFNTGNQRPTYPREDELYYGLNYIILSLRVLGARAVLFYSNSTVCSVACGRCRQLLGEVLGEGMAILLYADTLRVSPFLNHRLHGLFDHISITQILMRLLHDAVPVKQNKTSLFLKCIRPDGQLHCLLLVGISPVHLLRSKVCLTDDIDQPIDPTNSSCESSQDTDQDNISSTSRGRKTKNKSKKYRENPRPAKRHRSASNKSTYSVDLVGYRGCRINYIFLSTDEELSNSTNNIQQWINQGLRIPYGMLMELVNELNSNEQLVASLEKRPLLQRTFDGPRISYIVFKNEEQL